MEWISGYFGIDWLAMIMTFLSLHCLGAKKRSGFIFGMLANVSWFAFGVMAQSLANPIANVVFFSLNIRGYVKWGRQA